MEIQKILKVSLVIDGGGGGHKRGGGAHVCESAMTPDQRRDGEEGQEGRKATEGRFFKNK